MKKYIICDLDGTLCDHDHRLYLAWSGDWTLYNAACEFDCFNKSVMDFLKYQIQKNGLCVVFLTGRSDNFKSVTDNWLRKYGFENYDLLMRPEGNYEPAPEFKLSMLHAWRLDHNVMKEEIKFAIDDDERCVEMFKEYGIKKVIHYK